MVDSTVQRFLKLLSKFEFEVFLHFRVLCTDVLHSWSYIMQTLLRVFSQKPNFASVFTPLNTGWEDSGGMGVDRQIAPAPEGRGAPNHLTPPSSPTKFERSESGASPRLKRHKDMPASTLRLFSRTRAPRDLILFATAS